MRSLLPIWLLLGPLAQATGAQHAPCDVRYLLKPLTLNADVAVRASEKASFGTHLAPGVPFPALSDGPHVFIVDARGNIVFAERFPDLDEVHPVVTHRSLLQKLRSLTREEPKLIALGEIYVNHGQISSISNKAGTSFLPDESLPKMAKLLQDRGLPIGPHTPLVPHGQVSKGHFTEEQVARMRIEVQKDPVMKKLHERITLFRREIQKRYPDPRHPGQVDWRRYLTTPEIPPHSIDFADAKPADAAIISLLSSLEHPIDRYRFVPVLMERYEFPEIVEAMMHLDRYEGSLTPRP